MALPRAPQVTKGILSFLSFMTLSFQHHELDF